MSFSKGIHEGDIFVWLQGHWGNLQAALELRGPHQDELVVGQLTGPVGFGAVALEESLRAVNLVLILPSS